MRILHAIHDFLPRHRAGSEIYAHGLARAQAERGHQVHVLCAEYDPSREHGSLHWREFDEIPVTEIVNNWVAADWDELWDSPVIGRSLDEVLRLVRPDVVHIHNLLNLSFELPVRARAHGIPSVATLHDFTLVCPSGGQRIHRSEAHVCHEIDPDRCVRCYLQSPFHQQTVFARLGRRATGLALAGSLASRIRKRTPRLFAALGRGAARATQGIERRDIEGRLARARQVACDVDLWVAPSAYLGGEMIRQGLPEERVEVSDYGFAPLRGKADRAAGSTNGELTIGFVGTLAWHKGVHVLIDALAELADLPGWSARIYGSLETFPDYVLDLRRRAEGLPVTLEGAFTSERLREVYESVDVVVVPSLWPENSPLVIHEAFQAGRPVVGARSGGIVDLVRPGEGGWLVRPGDVEDLAATLRRLVERPADVREAARSLPRVKSLGEDAREWDTRYARVVVR